MEAQPAIQKCEEVRAFSSDEEAARPSTQVAAPVGSLRALRRPAGVVVGVLMATAMVVTVVLPHSTGAQMTTEAEFLALLQAASVMKATHKYTSVDGQGAPGVHDGSWDEYGSIVASEVELDATDPTNMTFRVGPPVTTASGEYLVTGSLVARDDCAYGMCGTLRAGWVNLRTTTGGTWQTGSEGLDGVVHLRLIEKTMQVDQKVTWTPATSQGVVASAPGSPGATSQEVVSSVPSSLGAPCEGQTDEQRCSTYQPADGLCFCSWSGVSCMTACA